MISNSLKMMVDANTAPVINSLSVTKNGTYTAPEGVDGYSPITVDVVEEPWEPLEDGYSNFWFELTNDTLSPWLNFSAKNADATIDWGDGSGEVVLDTLRPTHTYSKPGRYIVKVKGVTGIGSNIYYSTEFNYSSVVKHIELNSDVTSLTNSALRYFFGLEDLDVSNSSLSALSAYCISYCSSLKSIEIPSSVTSLPTQFAYMDFCVQSVILPSTITSILGDAFRQCMCLKSIIIPQAVTNIGNSAFLSCNALETIHCQPISPPTLGTNVFSGLPTNFIIYVPVGYGDTYKAASGWSEYADHIVEEGQQPNRAMLAKFNSAKTDEPQDDMR